MLNLGLICVAMLLYSSDSTGTIEEADKFETYMEENTPNQISVPGLSIFVQDKDQVCVKILVIFQKIGNLYSCVSRQYCIM